MKNRRSPLDETEVARIFREGSGAAVAALIRVFGDVDVAEDALQDAFLVALKRWPERGIPENPEGWIFTTARNRGIDRLRRESLGRSILSDVVRDRDEGLAPASADPMDDDRLRLIFLCCHPALSEEAQVALTLRLLGGLATEEVARAFLVSESTMAQRLVRAKRKIKSAHIPYRIPDDTELPARLPPVLAVLYLVYNAGASHPPGTQSAGGDLCAEGIRLARLMHELLPGSVEVTGLLALLLLNESRRGSRLDDSGALIRLRNQDRRTWNRLLIEEGQTLLRACLEIDEAGPYQIQAAIQAVHSDATTFEHTDWPQILALYDELLHMTRSQVVALNRAIVIAEVHGPAPALTEVEALDLDGYYLLHATRADLLQRLGRGSEAVKAYHRAAALAPTGSERDFLRAQARAANIIEPS